MAWYAIYETATGTLVSETSVQPGELRAGFAFVDVLVAPDRQAVTWDATTRTFVPRAVRREEIEQREVGGLYRIWKQWRDTRQEAAARGLAAAVLTALQARENAAWSAYAAALARWAAANS